MSVVLNFYYFMFMLGLIIFWPTDFRKSAIFDNFFGFQGGTASVFSFKSPNLAYSLLFICIFWPKSKSNTGNGFFGVITYV